MEHYFSRLEKQIRQKWNSQALGNCEGESITFGEMAAEIDRCHKYLKEHNINKGDKVAICAHNQFRWALAFLSINTYGAVAVPILDNFHPEGVCNILNHSDSVMLFTDADILGRLDTSAIKAVKDIVVLADFFTCQPIPAGFGPDNVHYPQDNDKELAVINYTSGSTGEPKGVMLRYECFSANVEYGQKRIPVMGGDRMLSILPMAHMFGLVFELLYPLCNGATIWYLGKAPSPTTLIKAMKAVRPFLVIAVPMVFEKIYNAKIKPALEGKFASIAVKLPLISNYIYRKIRKDLESSFGGRVRCFILGGAAVNPEVEAFLKRIGLHFTIGYGMTEAAPLIGYEDWDKFVLRSCGKPMDFVEVRIDSYNEANIPGEIQLRGVSLFSGYYNNPTATADSFTPDGWFKTGDLGTIDAEGNIYIKGRSKSMLLTSNGQNIYPEEIESILNSLPQVAESLVVGRDGLLVALIFPSERFKPTDDTAAEILSAANAKLPKYSHLAKVEFERDPFVKTPKLSIKRFLYR